MSSIPEALPPGTRLFERYVLGMPLGQGGFSITYEAQDTLKNDSCVVKELAPVGSRRNTRGAIVYDGLQPDAQRRLQHQFLNEAVVLRGLSVPGILNIRDSFEERQTSYIVTDRVPKSRTLEDILRSEGRLNADWVADIILQLAETLERVHARGVLHRDIKPSNVLVTDDDQVILIDFGAAREWHADRTQHHTVFFTPGYAPLEQLSPNGRRGPATDIYGLCAMAYTLLAGDIPPSAIDRVNGATMPMLQMLRPDADRSFLRAVQHGLKLHFEERPQSFGELKEIMHYAPDSGDLLDRLLDLDSKTVALRKLKVGRRQCPGCMGVLQEVKPLGKNLCPVCHQGKISLRNLATNLCPNCHHAPLHKIAVGESVEICPSCAAGWLKPAANLNPFAPKKMTCSSCTAKFEMDGENMTNLLTGDTHSVSVWRQLSGRSDVVWRCDGCQAEYDELPDGRREQVRPIPKPGEFKRLSSGEWDLVANDLDPTAGNATCMACSADFFVERDNLTLLKASRDPFGFAESFKDRCLEIERARWLAVGKVSPQPGLVCRDCHLELDFAEKLFQLVYTKSQQLRPCVGRILSLEDFHRAALDLPEVGRESELQTALEDTIVSAFVAGQLPLDDTRPDVIWVGPAVLDEKRGRTGTLTIDIASIRFKSGLKKFEWHFRNIVDLGFEDDDHFWFTNSDKSDVTFGVSKLKMDVQLKSGTHAILLTAADLAKRLATMLTRRT